MGGETSIMDQNSNKESLVKLLGLLYKIPELWRQSATHG